MIEKRRQRQLRDRHVRRPDLAFDQGADAAAMAEPVIVALRGPRPTEAIDLARRRLDQTEAEVDEAAGVAVLVELDHGDLTMCEVEIEGIGSSAAASGERHAAQGEHRGSALHLRLYLGFHLGPPLRPPGRTRR